MTEKKDIKRNKKKLGSYPFATVIFSIALSLAVIGFIGTLILLARTHVERVSNIELHVYLDHHISNAERLKIETILSAKPFIRKENKDVDLTYISQAEATERFLESDHNLSEEDILETLGFNPIRSCFVLTVNDKFSSVSHLKEIKQSVEEISGVFEVDLNKEKESRINALKKNIQLIRIILLVITVISVIAIVLLINNTIKLALFSQRFLIRSMQLVGAKSSFIQAPFLRRSLLHGLAGGFIASAIVYLALQYGVSEIKELKIILQSENIFILLGALPVTGAILALISTYRAVKKYLKLSLDELY